MRQPADVDTPWSRGRLDARAAPQQLLFGHMHEDVAIEARAFRASGRVFCIASAGDTAFALAESHPVVAVDINPVQLAYARTRLEGGPARDGIADRLLAVGRALAPLAGWRRKRLEEFLAFDSTAAQLAYWRQHLDTRRFRTGVDLLLSSTGLASAYAPAFRRLLPPRFGAVMRSRMERGFAKHPNASNPYARMLLLGDYPSPPRPRHPIQLVHADAAEYLESLPPASFDGFTLSNILDAASPQYRRRLLGALRRAGTPGALVVLRSFAEPAHLGRPNLAAEERSMLWGSVEVSSVDSSD